MLSIYLKALQKYSLFYIHFELVFRLQKKKNRNQKEKKHTENACVFNI